MFAELYRELGGSCARQLADRLADIDRDADWLESTISRYNAMWAYRQTLPDVAEQFEPLTTEHSALAAWITAGAKWFGPCLDLSQSLQQRIRVRTAGAQPEAAAATTRVAVVAWGLGQIVGQYDRTLPVVFCEPVADTSVRLAYDGLVRHVCGLPDADEWPEMIGSSILWRVCGLADGLRPQTPHLNVEASVNALISEMRPILPPAQLTNWAHEWRDFKDMRNGFTHVTAGERGRYSFVDVAARMRCRADVAVALTSITNFVGHTVAQELLDDDPTRWQVTADTLEYELDAYADLAP